MKKARPAMSLLCAALLAMSLCACSESENESSAAGDIHTGESVVSDIVGENSETAAVSESDGEDIPPAQYGGDFLFVKTAGGYAVTGVNEELEIATVPDSFMDEPVTAVWSVTPISPENCGIEDEILYLDGYTQYGYDHPRREEKHNEKLSVVAIPARVGDIQDGAFACAVNLEDILVSSTSNYYTCAGGVLFTSDMKVLRAFPAGKSGEYEVPGKTTNIASYAFANSHLTRVALPKGMMVVSPFAFTGSKQLTEISVAKGSMYFSDCDGVLYDYLGAELIAYPEGKGEEYTLPPKVTYLSEKISGRLCGISVLNIPASVEDIDYTFAFTDSGDLKEIKVDLKNQYFSSKNGMLLSKDGTELYYCPAAKSGTVEIPDGVVYIMPDAFAQCKNIERIVIPKSVSRLIAAGADIFNIPTLVGFDVSEDNVNFCSQDGVLYSKDKTVLLRCPQKASGTPTLPDGLAEISPYAFSGSGVTFIDIPDSVTVIGFGAFSNCKALKEVKLPSGLTDIADELFLRCTALEKADIPDGVTEICFGAFSGCTALKEVKLPERLEYIYARVFYACTSLDGLELPDGIKRIIGDAFDECDVISIKYLGGAYAGISALHEHYPDLVMYLSDNNFLYPLD